MAPVEETFTGLLQKVARKVAPRLGPVGHRASAFACDRLGTVGAQDLAAQPEPVASMDCKPGNRRLA